MLLTKTLNYLDKSSAFEIFSNSFNKIPSDHWQRKYLSVHKNRLIETLTAIPISQNSGLQALDAGTSGLMLEWLTDHLGYDKSFGTVFSNNSVEFKQMSFDYLNNGRIFDTYHLNIEKKPLPCETNKFSLITFCEVLEHFVADPMFFLIEANRVLKSEGFLFLTTPNSASQRCLHHILNGKPPYNYYSYNKHGENPGHRCEYTPGLVKLLLESSGFEIIGLSTPYCDQERDEQLEKFLSMGGYSYELRGEQMFVLAQKVSVPKTRYPRPLYK